MTFPFNSHHDYECYGFDRGELERFLNIHGQSLQGQKAAAMTTYPAWGKDFIGIDEFNIEVCALLLCGIDPASGGDLSGDEHVAKDKASSQLDSAMKRSELSPVGTDTQGAPLLNAEAVRQWCPSVGRTWPIPPRPVLPAPMQHSANDAPLLEKLRDAETRALAAEAKLKAQGEVIDTTEQLCKQIAELQSAAVRLEVGKKQAETEIANGKSRTTMLKLIGGMAMLQKVPIHGTRIHGLTALINDLASVSVSVSENTLRGLLNEAAQNIEPPSN